MAMGLLLPCPVWAAAPEEPAAPTLERMLGAMLMLGFRGSELSDSDPFLAMVQEGKIANFILFDKDVTENSTRNIVSKEQLRQLTARLRAAAPGPIFIGVDQEGGQVRRLKPQKGFMDVPSAQVMGQANPRETFDIASRLGAELKSLGINLDFAPVVDVDTNPFNPAIGRLGRSFGTDAAKVSAHALAFGRGLAKNGVVPCLKHFPGQGCSGEDSHLQLPDITQCWQPDVDLAAFAQIFKAGWPGMVMTGHLFHKDLDDSMPATLSRKIITGLLREGMGWSGVVISDDLQMKAITQNRDLKEILREAIEAGVDILLLANNIVWEENLPQKAWETLTALVEEGAVTKERVRESWQRISTLHDIYGN